MTASRADSGYCLLLVAYSYCLSPIAYHYAMTSLAQRVRDFIRKRDLLRPGQRVAVAVSGGADSVALLRLLLGLREELGIVLSVAHLHHGIREAEADADRDFVIGLARHHELELHAKASDALAYASSRNVSLEAAGRQLRYAFFSELLGNSPTPESVMPAGRDAASCVLAAKPPSFAASQLVDRVATAHTLDDQAETVLMKLARGAGTRGLAGIFPEQTLGRGSIVRPLLEIRGQELRGYLSEVGQAWREDSSNADLSFTRNRVRARVLPALRVDLNPAIETSLAHLAAIAHAEEEYWNQRIADILPQTTVPGAPTRGGGRKQTREQSVSFDVQKLLQQPLAVQRRLLRTAAAGLGCNLDFEHVEGVRELTNAKAHGKKLDIAGAWRAHRLFRELRIENLPAKAASIARAYEHKLRIPGSVRIMELGATIRARISEVNGNSSDAAYNRAHSIKLTAIEEISVRNWRPGDRFRPARSATEKRVKELLYSLHLTEEQKIVWPVLTVGERIIWIRGIDSPEIWLEGTEKRLVIEETAE